jgi:hypothetical protein
MIKNTLATVIMGGGEKRQKLLVTGMWGQK